MPVEAVYVAGSAQRCRTRRCRRDHRTGSGDTLGVYSHAPGPRTSDFTRCFHPDARWVIERGMVFHMYASAESALFSATVLVTDSGPERLIQLPRTLIVNNSGALKHEG